MTRPLHIYPEIHRSVVRFTASLCLVILATGGYAQLDVTTTECNCLNNGSQPGDGQYMESFTITSNPGETWTLQETNNFYDPVSLAPPIAPTEYMGGTVITEGPAGQYTLTGLRIEGFLWEVVVSDGTEEYTITSDNACSYPDERIYGDLNNCISQRETYYVDIPEEDIASISWSISGGGIIVGPTDEREVEIAWGDMTGTHQVMVTVEANVGAPMGATTCMFMSTVDVELVDEASVYMACNNYLNLSLSQNCTLEVTPEQFLESSPLDPSSFDIQLRDIEADTIIPNGIITGAYIGKEIEVSVIHDCSLNSCWGLLTVEDKSAPSLVCQDVEVDCDDVMDPEFTGFPLPLGTTLTKIGDRTYLLEGYDLCGDATLRYEDLMVDNLCTGPYSSIITRTWYITDENGNTSSCTSTISVLRAPWEDIVFPGNWHDLTGPNPSLEACDDFLRLENGAPDPSVTGYPTGTLCAGATVLFEDVILPKCGEDNVENAYKVLRRWTVREHCPPNRDTTHTQVISVEDRIDPVITVDPLIEISTTEHECAALVKIPPPEVEECSTWRYTVAYMIKDENGEPSGELITDGLIIHPTDGSYLLEDVPADQGDLWIVYTVTDACGNSDQATAELTIVDTQEPIPVCDLYSYVSLDEDGVAKARYHTFDDGSWDNCGIASYELRRMEDFACGLESEWGEKVSFCCEDVGEEVMVQMRITDFAGNTNSCMVNVVVQDNILPEWITCPEDMTIDCDDDYSDLSAFGFPTAMDNCDVTISTDSVFNLNDCGIGIILRNFTAEDPAENKLTKTQRIYVVNKDAFDKTFIKWPEHVTLPDGCSGGSLLPEDLPVGARYPVLTNTSCSNAIYDYEDTEFQYVDGACTKILRVWTVVDWCQYNPVFSNRGIWYHTQVIKVLNSEAPVITQGCSEVQGINYLNECEAEVTLIAQATDDCTAPEDLHWAYKIDIGNNGTTDRSGTDNDASSILPIGMHSIEWTVTDECGVSTSCTLVFELEDKKKPSPVCYTDLVTVIMGETGEVTIWASDFNKGSYDNCYTSTDLIASFTEDTDDIYRTFTCDDLDEDGRDTFQLRMYVTDPSDNFEYCTMTIIIQDNNNYCSDNSEEEEEEEEQSIAVGGHIYNEDYEMMDGVEIMLSSHSPEFPMMMTTDANGTYAFQELKMYDDYSVEPSKKDDYRSGVSTLDVVLIQRHILGLQDLTSHYQQIAADVNNSGSVSASDIIQLRKLVLGVIDELPETDPWRFVDASQSWDEGEAPFPFNEIQQVHHAVKDEMEIDFIGIKVGDINGSASNNARGQTSRSIYSMGYKILDHPDGLLEIQFVNTGKMSIEGFQFELDIQGSGLTYEAATSGGINMHSSHLLVRENEGVRVSVSWNNDGLASVQAGHLFSLHLRKRDDGVVPQVKLITETIKPEIYNGNLETRSLDIAQLDGSYSITGMVVFQNAPNPFNQSTIIPFALEQDQDVTLRVYDLGGKLIYNQTRPFMAGFQEWMLESDQLNSHGILYYQVEAGTSLVTKKMINLK